MIAIKNMKKMPGDCTHCLCFNDEYDKCKAPGCWKKGFCDWEGRPDWCPLIEIPDNHGDLIDRSKLDYAFTALRFDEEGLAHYGDRHDWLVKGVDIEKLIYNAPTIIPAEEG